VIWGKKKPETTDPPTQTGTPPPQKTAQPEPAGRRTFAQAPESSESMTIQDLPELLLAHANVTPEQIRLALEIQLQTGDFIGEILLNEGILDENSLVAFLSKYCKIPHLSLLNYVIDAKLLELVPPSFCMRHRLIPIDKMGRNLTVAMVNPMDSFALESLREGYPDLRIRPILCTTKHFNAVTGRLFRKYSGKMDFLKEDGTPGGGPEDALATEPVLKHSTKEQSDADGVAGLTGGNVGNARAKVRGGTADQNGRMVVTDEHRDALLDSVFSASQAGVRDECGDDAIPGDGDAAEQVARKMTSAMVQSMHNTYHVLERRVRFFHGLAPEAIARLFARGKMAEYEAGEIIYQKGEAGRYMFVILNGEVDIIDDGQSLVHLKKGEIFGEMALVSNTKRIARAQTAAATSLLMLSFDDITQGLDNATSIQLLVNIIMTLSSRPSKA
jgi:hypothetical protein